MRRVILSGYLHHYDIVLELDEHIVMAHEIHESWYTSSADANSAALTLLHYL